MNLRKWDDLPEYMKNKSVKKYYDVLCKKKTSLALKRAFDVITSLIMLVLFSPVMLVIAVMIKCDSKGPVFFRQERVTQYGRVFRIYKFRTMVNNAQKLGAQVTVSNDARITKVGALLRKGRLDEIPQLINILLGDMTFVGTRPEVVKYVKAYSPKMYATLLLPAGLTSRTSIYYKDEDELLKNAADPDAVYINEVLPGKMKYNLLSLRKFSFMSDIMTMFETFFAVIK